MSTKKYLTQEQQLEYIEKSKNGDQEARNTLIMNYLDLVKRIARESLKTDDQQIELDDLINQGVFGIVDSIKSYDSCKGIFSTHVYVWIKEYINSYIRQNSCSLKEPHRYSHEIRKIEQTKYDLSIKLERMPSLEELASELKRDVSYIQEKLLYKKRVFHLAQPVKNGNYYNGTSDLICLEDTIAASNLPVEDEIFNKEVKNTLLKIIDDSQMSDKNKIVIKTMYFSQDNVLTQEQVQKKLKCNSRVDGIIKQALSRIRKNKHRKELLELYQEMVNYEGNHISDQLDQQIINDLALEKQLNERNKQYKKKPRSIS